MANGKVRIGVVGGGFGAAFHWHQHPDCTVVGVADLIEGRRANLAQRYGCANTYESLEEMLRARDLDAVAVFSGGPDHVRQCVAVMNTGRHCISAVPAGLTLEECAELVEAKERNGVRYMMAETSYYRSHTIRAREMYAAGEFGELRYVEGEYYHPGIGTSTDGLSVVDGQRTWRWAYPPMLYPTHSTAFHVGVTGGRLTSVSCMGTRSDEPAFRDNVYNNPFDNEVALFETSDGAIFRCNVMWNALNHGERADWYGTQASLFMPNWAGQPSIVRYADGREETGAPDYTDRLPEALREDSGHGGSHPYLTHEFVRAIVEDREPAVNVYEAVAMTAPGIVAHESALRDGERLKVPQYDR